MTEYVTYASLVIILIVFAYFMFQTLKLRNCRRIVTKVLERDDLMAFLQESKLSAIAEVYKKCITFEIDGQMKTNVPASEFFTETSVGKVLSLNHRMIGAASSTLVGLGVLGTFVGLSIGVGGIKTDNTEAIQKGIDSLLDGVSTAFYTSLAGMTFSLIYTAFEKRWKNRLDKALFDLTEKLDEAYYIDDNALMQNSKQKLFNEFQAKMEKYIEVQTNTITSALTSHLTYDNAEGKQVGMANAVREILKENEEQSKALKSFSTDLALELNNGFDEVMSRQMQEKLLPLMENIDGTTKAVIEHIDLMAANVASPATDMIQNVVDELKNSMSLIMQEFKNNLSGDATNELEELAKSLGTATQAMANFPKNMENISATLQVTIEEVKNAISEISNTSAASSDKAMQQMQEQIVFATTSISNVISEVKDVMILITRSSEQSSNDVINKLASASQQIGTFMNDAMSQMSASMHESIKEVLSSVNASLMDVSKAVTTITQSSEHSSLGVLNQLTTATEQLSGLMQNTMNNVTTSVKDSMKSITDDVVNKQSDLLALQASTMEETKKLLIVFNNGLSKLEQVNIAVNGTMDMFQQAQGQITGSTAHLQTITGDMKLATELFNKGQNNYAIKLAQLQTSSQQGIDQVTEILKNSGELSEEYAEKFEIIKQGISSIFAQLQSGLNEYSRIVKDSTDKYLANYTSSLTQTTGALASAIERQNEVTEMLTDTITRNKR